MCFALGAFPFPFLIYSYWEGRQRTLEACVVFRRNEEICSTRQLSSLPSHESTSLLAGWRTKAARHLHDRRRHHAVPRRYCTSLLPRKLGCQPPTSSGARQKLGCSCPVSAIAIGADRLFSNRPASMLQWRSPLKKRGWLWCKSRIAMNQSSHPNAALPIMRTSQSQELSRTAGRFTTQQPLDDGMGTGDHRDHSPKGTALLGDLFLHSSHPFPQISHVCTLRYFIDGTARPISGALGVTSNLEP